MFPTCYTYMSFTVLKLCLHFLIPLRVFHVTLRRNIHVDLINPKVQKIRIIMNFNTKYVSQDIAVLKYLIYVFGGTR